MYIYIYIYLFAYVSNYNELHYDSWCHVFAVTKIKGTQMCHRSRRGDPEVSVSRCMDRLCVFGSSFFISEMLLWVHEIQMYVWTFINTYEHYSHMHDMNMCLCTYQIMWWWHFCPSFLQMATGPSSSQVTHHANKHQANNQDQPTRGSGGSKQVTIWILATS